MKPVLIFLLFLSYLSNAQESKIKSLQVHQKVEKNYTSSQLKLEKIDNNPFIAFSIAIRGKSIHQNIKAVYYKNIQNQWELFLQDKHNTEEDAWYALTFLDKNIQSTQLKIIFKKATELDEVSLNYYYPKETSFLKASTTTIQSPIKEVEGCNCAKPPTIPRSEWCPNNNCPPNPNPIATEVKFLVVHHTATSNTSNDWAAAVRSIWDFHVNTRGWADIGYNFLIDKNGKIYEAREDDSKGAHFSGHNSETSGISLLGTYSTVTPSEEIINSLESLLTWKSCDKSIDPLAIEHHASSNLNLHTIPGHRDGGNTTCPGNKVYERLPEIRTQVNTQLNACTLSVNENAFTNLLIYPNPFTNTFTIRSSDIDFNTTINIICYDVMGSKVYQKTATVHNNKAVLNLGFLFSGTYFVTIQSDTKISHFRLIKK